MLQATMLEISIPIEVIIILPGPVISVAGPSIISVVVFEIAVAWNVSVRIGMSSSDIRLVPLIVCQTSVSALNRRIASVPVSRVIEMVSRVPVTPARRIGKGRAGVAVCGFDGTLRLLLQRSSFVGQ